MTTFATIDDLALRMGKESSDDFTAAQQAQGERLLELVTGLIIEAVDKDTTWADALDPIPTTLTAVTVEAVARVMLPLIQNPSGVSSQTETLGAYSYTARYGTDGDSGSAGGAALELTSREARWARWAVRRSNVDVIEVESIFDQDLPL